MHEDIQSHFDTLVKDMRKTDIPAERQQRVVEAIAKLSSLYTQYRETNSSRFGDEITRQVQAVLKDLESCPKAQKLDAEFRDGLRVLHEEFGIPPLALKPLAVPRKTRKK